MAGCKAGVEPEADKARSPQGDSVDDNVLNEHTAKLICKIQPH